MSPGKKTGTVPKQKKSNKCTTPQKPATSTPNETENISVESLNSHEAPVPNTELRHDRGNESSWPTRIGGSLVPLLESSEVPSPDIEQPCSSKSGPPYFSVLETCRQFAPRLNLDNRPTPSLNIMSDIESEQSVTSNASSWQVIPQKPLPEKEKNKTTNVTTSLDERQPNTRARARARMTRGEGAPTPPPAPPAEDERQPNTRVRARLTRGEGAPTPPPAPLAEEGSVANGPQELTPQVLEARDEQLSLEHARIQKEILGLFKKPIRIEFANGPVDGFNLLAMGLTRPSTDSNDWSEGELNDLDEAPPPPLSDELTKDYKAKQDRVNELHAKAAHFEDLAKKWTGEVLFPDEENTELPSTILSVEAMDVCEDEAVRSCPNVAESPASQHDDEDEINICHHNQHRKPDNIGLSIGFQKEQSRELDRKMAAIKEMHNVLNQVRGMRARGERVPSSHLEQMAELANMTRFQTHPDMTPRHISLEEHVPDLLPNCRNDLLNHEGTTVPQRSHLPISAPSSDQNVSRLRQDTSEVSGLVDHVQTTNLLTARPTREQLQNYDARGVDTDLRPSTHEDRRVAQVDLEHKKKILEELMRKDQGLISVANQDNKTTQDKANAQLFTRHCGDRTSSAAEQEPSPRNSREDGLEDPLNNSHVEPGSWGSSISRVMEQWLSDGGVCLDAESTPHSPVDSNHHRIQQGRCHTNQSRDAESRAAHSPVDSNYHRIQQQGRRHTNQSRDSCSEENLRNLNVVPTVANRHPQAQSPQTNARSQCSPMNVPNPMNEDTSTILNQQRYIQKLERQLQNVMLKEDVPQYVPGPNPNLAASNVGRGIPQVMPPIGVPHPGTDHFYQQMLAASQLQQSQLLTMSMNYCHQTVWLQQQELSRLSAVVSSMQGTRQENYSPPIPLGQGVVFTSEATIPQQGPEHPQSNLARNSTNLSATYTLRTLNPSHLGGNQVPADILPNGGISNARSLPNLYPPLSPLQGTTHTYIQPPIQRNNGSSNGLAVGRHPVSQNNRYQLPQPRILDSYEPRLQMASDVLPSQTFPPYANGMPNNSNFNLTTSSPMLDQGAWGGNRLPVPTAALNNQVPPGNRANNYWDNFRSYSRLNLLSGTTKTNEASSVPPVYPIADRMVNTVQNPTQTQSTQTLHTQAQTRPTQTQTRTAQAQTQPFQAQVRYTSSQKRNLNMHEPELLPTNPDANKYSPNTRQDINHIMLRQTQGPYNDIYEIRHPRNQTESNSELGTSCPRGTLLTVATGNQQLSDSSKDNHDFRVQESMPRTLSRDHTYAIPEVQPSERDVLHNPMDLGSDSSQLINVMLPDTSSDEEGLPRRRRLLSQNIERLKKQFVKQSNRVSDRSCLPNTEDSPPAYESVTNSFAVQQDESSHHDDLPPPHWQRVHDPSRDTMAALSLVAGYLRSNESSIINQARIEELVHNVHDRMLPLCNHPKSKWETQHLQNFLATLKQELICFIGKRCSDVTSKILANMKSNLFGCFEFNTPIHGPCPDIAIQQGEGCASTSNPQWGTESTPTNGQNTNHLPTALRPVFEPSTLQPTSLVNNDRDLAEADQSYSQPFWKLPPTMYNPRHHMQTRLAAHAERVRPSPQGRPTQATSQTSTETEINSVCNNMATGEVFDTTPRDTYNHGDIGNLDQVPTRLSDSHQQPVSELDDLPNTNYLSPSHHDDIDEDGDSPDND